MTELLDKRPALSEGRAKAARVAGAEEEVSPPHEWRLARGLELVGEFESSALAERPCLVRRQDGQVIQLSPLVYAIASCLDGGATLDEITAAASARTGRSISPENVEYLIEKKLVPLGVVGTGATDATTGAKLPRSRALLALRFRTRVVPNGCLVTSRPHSARCFACRSSSSSSAR